MPRSVRDSHCWSLAGWLPQKGAQIQVLQGCLKWEEVTSFMQKTEGQGAGWGQSDQLNDLKIGGEQEKQDTIAGDWGRGLLSRPGPAETR